jgi:hypothetical protein
MMQEDTRKDNNKIMTQIYLIYIFRVFRLVCLIVIMSYFLGTSWFIVTKMLTNDPDEFTFYNVYGMAEKTDDQNLIISCYFIFTTLATVGFGDYTPKSDTERSIMILILLVGVATFSYIMGQFIQILLNL